MRPAREKRIALRLSLPIERERERGGDTKEERGICAGRSNVSRHNKHVAAIVRAQGGYRSGQYADTREKGGGEVPPSLME